MLSAFPRVLTLMISGLRNQKAFKQEILLSLKVVVILRIFYVKILETTSNAMKRNFPK